MGLIGAVNLFFDDPLQKAGGVCDIIERQEPLLLNHPLHIRNQIIIVHHERDQHLQHRMIANILLEKIIPDSQELPHNVFEAYAILIALGGFQAHGGGGWGHLLNVELSHFEQHLSAIREELVEVHL